MISVKRPSTLPTRPFFSSGPTAKHPQWNEERVAELAFLSRSHRAAKPREQIIELCERLQKLAGAPDDFLTAIVPASDTGAMEMALWSLLGARPVDVFAWDSFGLGWANDISKQLKVDDCRIHKADYGKLPDFSQVRSHADIVFTWNGTTAGARITDTDWIAEDREGLVICDATSAIYSEPMDWRKIDVLTFSWQKALGGEAAHGILMLGPRAIERLDNYTPPWPLPKIMRMSKAGKHNADLFRGATINTPSMWCVADCLETLNWVDSIGGVEALYDRVKANINELNSWLEQSNWAENLVTRKEARSLTSPCIRVTSSQLQTMAIDEQWNFVSGMASIMEKEGAAYDVKGHRDAPPCLRIWCGPTIDSADIKALCPWLDWAFAEMSNRI